MKRTMVRSANGKKKAPWRHGFMEGQITSMGTASVLKFHQSGTVILDEEAATGLRCLDHYR